MSVVDLSPAESTRYTNAHESAVKLTPLYHIFAYLDMNNINSVFYKKFPDVIKLGGFQKVCVSVSRFKSEKSDAKHVICQHLNYWIETIFSTEEYIQKRNLLAASSVILRLTVVNQPETFPDVISVQDRLNLFSINMNINKYNIMNDN